jgi:hypothetical protein
MEDKTQIDTIFSIRSTSFGAENWEVWSYTCLTLLSPATGHGSSFEVSTEGEHYDNESRIICGLSEFLHGGSKLGMQLVRRNQNWLIQAGYERDTEGKLVDHATVRLSDGRDVLLKLRRLPGSASARHRDVAIKLRYEISVEIIAVGSCC